MNAKQKIMGLAALPIAGLLATGGVALAQGAAAPAGAPAGTQVVQQVAAQRTGNPAPAHPVRTMHQAPTTAAGQQSQVRDRDQLRDGSCDQQAAPVQTADRTRDRARDGSCDHQASTAQAVSQVRDRDQLRDGSCGR